MVLATKKNCQRVLAASLRVVSAMTGNPPLLAANSKLVENFELSSEASTRCSGDNKEKLSANIRSEYASDFCHDRKSAFKATFHLTISMRGQNATSKIQRNNYHHGSCGPSLTGKTMSVFLILRKRRIGMSKVVK